MNMDFVTMNLVTLLYLVASICFIQALKGLSHPTTSIRGNIFGMLGMTIAVITTAASCGAVNAMHDSFTALGGMIPLINMQLGEIIVGWKGVDQPYSAEALAELLDAAPAMRPQLRSAEWVGNRRWNLTFKTGQVLALPEGKDQSSKALMTFAQLDGRNRLLGGKAVAFDMRAPDRIYLRVPGRTDPVEQPAPKAAETAKAVAKPVAAKPAAKTEEKE